MDGVVNAHMNYIAQPWRAGVEMDGPTETLPGGLIVSRACRVKGALLHYEDFCARGWIGWWSFWVGRDVGKGGRVAETVRVEEWWKGGKDDEDRGK